MHSVFVFHKLACKQNQAVEDQLRSSLIGHFAVLLTPACVGLGFYCHCQVEQIEQSREHDLDDWIGEKGENDRGDQQLVKVLPADKKYESIFS